MIKLYNCLCSALNARAQNEGDEFIGSPPGALSSMRKTWLLNMLIAIFFLGAANSWSQVSAYGFAQASGSYTEITGGTVLATATTANDFDSASWTIADGSIPFSFNFNGTNYTGCYVNSNGSVHFGGALTSSGAISSSSTAYAGAIAGFSGDLNASNVAGTTSQARWEVVGSAPNREFVIQFKNWRTFFSSSTTNFHYINFQIRLVETSNVVKVVYGPSGFAIGSTTTSGTRQIGLRGATNADFNNRSNASTVLFANSVQGTANNATQAFNTVTTPPGMPASGLTYTWTPPTCLVPGAPVISTITTSTANLSWGAASPAPSSGYMYEVRTSGAAGSGPTGLAFTNTTGAGVTSAALSGLSTNTAYTVYVRSNCGGSDLSNWTFGTSFRTPCDAISVPYTEGFEGLTVANTLPACMYSFPDVSLITKTRTYIASATGTNAALSARTGTKFAAVNWSPAATAGYFLSVPLQLTGGVSYTASVFYKTDGVLWTDATLAYGSSPTAAEMTNTIATVANAAATAYTEIKGNFTPATTGVYYVSFRGYNATSAPNYIVFDDFTVIATPSCVEPTGVTTTSLTSEGATLSWTASVSAPANGYEYEVRTSGAAGSGPTGLVAEGTTAAGVTTASVSGLTPDTNYSIYVRSACAGATFSQWTNEVVIRTGYCVPVGLSTSTTYFITNVTTTNGVTNFNNTTGAGTNGYANFSTTLSASQFVGAPINLSITTSTSTHYFYVWIDFNNDFDFNDAGETVLNTSGSGYAASYSGSFTLPVGTPEGTYRMRVGQSFSPQITSCGPSTYGEYEDYTFSVVPVPTCFVPSALAASAISSTGATITWTAPSQAPSNGYEYFVSTSATAPTAATTATGSTGAGVTTAALSLTADTVYYVWVRSVCDGADKSAWTSAITFRTPCTSATLPYTEGFNVAATTSASPTCWSQQFISDTIPIHQTTTSPGPGGTLPVATIFEGSGMVFFNSYTNSGDSTRLVSPPINTTGTANVSANFQWYYSTEGGATLYLNEGVTVQWSTNGTTWNDFSGNFIRRYGPVAGWAPISIALPAGAGNIPTLYVGFKLTSNAGYDTYMDLVKITASPTCFAPTTLTVSNIAPTTADVSWSVASPVPGVGYEYAVTASSTPPASGTAIAGTSASVSGLTAGTVYYLHVRSECTAGTDYSDWNTKSFQFIDGDDCEYAIDLATQTSPISSTTVGLRDDFDPTCNGAAAVNGADKFYVINVPVNWTLSIGQTANNYDSVHAMFYGSCAAQTQIMCLDGNETTAVVWQNTTGSAQNVYWVQDVYLNTNGTFTLAWSLTPPPIVVSSFTPATVCSADLATSVVTLTGSNFTNTTSVTLNSVSTPFTIVNDTTIEVNLTASSTAGAFTVYNAETSGTSAGSLTINTNPTVAPITGPSFVCLPNSNTITLSSATPTGTWSSSDEDIATVSASGVVTPVTEGDVTISYTVTDTGCSTTQTYAVSVNEPVVISSSTATQTIVTDGDTFFTAVASGTPSGDFSQLTYQWEIYTDPDPEVQDDEFFTPLTDGPVYGGTDTATLTLTNVPASLNETLYHVVITGACNVAISDLAVLIVGETGIEEQPENATVCEGTNSVSFTVDASEDVTAYQWEEDQGGDNWLPITDGGVYSGATTESLTLTGFNGTFSGYKYRVSVTGIGSATSNAALLTIVPSATITTDPTDQSVCYSGGSATFTAAATNADSFQWEYSANGGANWNTVADGVPTGATYTGAATSTLTVDTTAATPASGTYSYRAVANSGGSCPGDISASAQLTINNPAITAQPVPTTVLANGSTATFTVGTSAGTPTYQWQYATVVGGPYTDVVDGTPAGLTYAGANTATLSVTASNFAAASTARYYRAIVSSPVGCSSASNGAQLTITGYCIPSPPATSTASYFSAFSTTGGATNITNNASGFSPGGYGNFTNLSASEYKNESINFSATLVGTSVGVAIWVDWNQNGTFEPTERVYNTTAYTSTTPHTGSFVIPDTALAGTTRMRIFMDFNNSNPATPCGPFGSATTPRGEVEDYTFVVLNQPACEGTPTAGTATASTTNICNSGSTTLTVTGYTPIVTGLTFQWYNSAGLIPGAEGTTYVTPVLTASDQYFVRVSCGVSGLSADSNTITVNVNNPAVVSTTTDERCGVGTLDLSATGSAGTTLNWYAAATGGTPLYTGTNFTTPIISSTTTYYVSASTTGSPINVGRLAPTGGTGTNLTTYGQVFTLNEGTRLNSVNVVSTTGTSVTIALYNSGGTTLLQTSGSVTVPTNATTTVNLGWDIAPGTYRLMVTGMTGSFIRENSGITYPIPLSTFGQITGFVSALTGSVTTSASYYFLYNWSMTPACPSARIAVEATVTAPPALTLSSSSATICSGVPSGVVSVTSNVSDFDTYTWNPTTGVSGSAASGYTFNPATNTSYTLTASNAAGCANTATFAVTVNPLPAPTSIGSNSPVCAGGTLNLTSSAIPPNGYTMNSNSGVSYIDIGSTGTSIGTISDDSEHNVVFPSPFSYNGVAYTGARVAVNGVIVFGATTGEVGVGNAALPSSAVAAGSIFLAPYWDDLDVNIGGTVKTQTVGSNFIIQFTNVDHNSFTTGGINFQVQMNLTTGTISYVYPDVTFGSATYDAGMTATIGLQFSSTSAIHYSTNTASLTNGQSISFSPNNGTYSWTGPNGFSSALQNPTIANVTTAASGVYTLTVSNSFGCPASSSTTNVVINALYPFYADADGDTYGAGPVVQLCAVNATTPPAGYSVNNTDCNDNIAAINPGATEVPFDGVDNNCNNQLDEGNQLTTQLLPEVCNTTLTSIGSLIGITTVNSSITAYRIRVTNGAQVQIIERDVPHFTLPMLPSYQYATTYTVEIELQRNGVWVGYYGPSCTVSSPPVLDADGSTQVSPSQCGITLARINTLIATTSLQGVTGYRFRVTNITPGASGPNVIQTIDRANHWFSLPMLTQYNYGSTYRIEVAIKTNGTYSGFGAPCEVSSPAAPTLINCGGVVASASTLIAATSLQGVTQYRFQVVRMSDNTTTTIDRNNNYFTFAMVPGYTQAAQYGVRVAVMTAGTWSPFGDACEITSPGAGTRFTPATTPMDVLGFKAVAYPNPFASTFNIDVTSSIAEQVQIRVYDMTGKLIETREANASDLNTLNVGDRYPAGVYNVIVTQGVNVKTLRVIKR